MKKNRWVLRLVTLLVISGALMTAALAAEVGSSKDPLVTLSYLEEVFKEQILEDVEQEIEKRNSDIAKMAGAQTGSGGSADSFVVVDLANGQTLTGGIGCEVMLRVGKAVCVAPSNPGLIDQTTAGTLAGGKALETNHLYMMTIDGRGVKAASDTVKVLVRGSYTIG